MELSEKKIIFLWENEIIIHSFAYCQGQFRDFFFCSVHSQPVNLQLSPKEETLQNFELVLHVAPELSRITQLTNWLKRDSKRKVKSLPQDRTFLWHETLNLHFQLIAQIFRSIFLQTLWQILSIQAMKASLMISEWVSERWRKSKFN